MQFFKATAFKFIETMLKIHSAIVNKLNSSTEEKI